jgi:hypothetical protein
MLTDAEMAKLLLLINGARPPDNGMEKHFIKVINGTSIACTAKEKEWYEYWINSQNKIEPTSSKNSNVNKTIKKLSKPHNQSYIDWTSPAFVDIFQLPVCSFSNAIGLS